MKASDASYLAGFLDGSIHFQLVRQREYRFGFYIRASLSLSQSTSARHGLKHLQRVIGGGYLRDRGTGMSDLVLVVTSRPLLVETLQAVEPYVIFKREHVRRALWLLPQLGPRLDVQEFLRMAREVDTFAALNYSKTKRISAADVEQHLRSKGVVAPVTTSPIPLDRGDGSPATWQIYEAHNTPAPRNGVKV